MPNENDARLKASHDPSQFRMEIVRDRIETNGFDAVKISNGNYEGSHRNERFRCFENFERKFKACPKRELLSGVIRYSLAAAVSTCRLEFNEYPSIRSA
jgi:hypothetical protein